MFDYSFLITFWFPNIEFDFLIFRFIYSIHHFMINRVFGFDFLFIKSLFHCLVLSLAICRFDYIILLLLYFSKIRFFEIGLFSTKDSGIGESVEIDWYNFEVVKDFVYIGSSINTNNEIRLEIRRRITLANRCYLGLSNWVKKPSLGERRFAYILKSLILPVLLYGAETWTMTSSDEQS